MKRRLLFASIIATALMATALIAGSRPSLRDAKAESNNFVNLITDATVVEGSTHLGYLYLRTTEEINAFSVDIYFDSSAFEVTSRYNSIEATIYDSSIHDDHLTFTYVFASLDLEYEQCLFYFQYRVKDGAALGNYNFDVVVNEAYNSSLEEVEVSGMRKKVTVEEKPVTKSAHAYLNGSSSINTAIDEEFTFSYNIDTLNVAGGTFLVQYDDELFEFVSLTKGAFFDDMMFDYNASGKGEVYISFAAVEMANSYSLFSIRLKTIKNVAASSKITMTASNLYDIDLVDMGFSCQQLSIDLSYDSSYLALPKMSTSYEVDEVNKEIVATISLEADSHLGAGDFLLRFDKAVIAYVGYQKRFSPTFFTVNDKAKQLDQGQVKFSILSTSDIITATEIIKFTFSYAGNPHLASTYLELIGSGLTDSLTKPIDLNVLGINVSVSSSDPIVAWSKEYLFMDDDSFLGLGSGRCRDEGLYVTAKRELLLLDEQYIEAFENNADSRYTPILERYLAWARANGDTSPFAGDGIVLESSLAKPYIDFDGNVPIFIASAMAIVIIVGIVAAGYLASKKRSR